MPDFLETAGGKTVIIAAFLVAMFIAERVRPQALARPGLARVMRNVTLAALNAALSPLIVIPLSMYLAAMAPQWRPELLTGWLALPLDLLLLDFWIYWWHRANHVVPALWRFHVVHHLDEHLDTTSALRFHFGEVLLSALVRGVVIFACAIPVAHVVVFEILVALGTIFHHSNLRVPERLERWMSCVLVTPSIHWLHHHAERRDTDSSYATLLSVWDRLFGSVSSSRRTPAMRIGVEGEADSPILRLLIRPFKS